MTEEEMQEWLDKQNLPQAENNEETKAYKQLYEMLNAAPESHLAPGFAHRVTARITGAAASEKKLHITLFLSISALLFVAMIALAIFWGIPDIAFTGPVINISILLLITAIISLIYHQMEKKVRRQI